MAGWLLSIVLLLTVSNVYGVSFTQFCDSSTSVLTECKNRFLTSSYLKSYYNSVDKLNQLSASELYRQCDNSSVLGEFYDCISKKLLDCIPQKWQKVFPGLKNMKSYMNYICDNVNDIDTTCITSLSNLRQLSKCASDHAPSQTGDLSNPDDVASLLCRMVTIGIDCEKSSFSSCPDKTIDFIVKAYDYQRPESCHACIARPSLIAVLVSLLLFLINPYSA